RPAVFPELRPELAPEDPRARPAATHRHRRPRTGRVPCRYGAQSRRLVWRIWREARAEALSHRRRSRPRVVKRRRAHMKETTLMRVRIVVADQSEARFYDTEGLHGPL